MRTSGTLCAEGANFSQTEISSFGTKDLIDFKIFKLFSKSQKTKWPFHFICMKEALMPGVMNDIKYLNN